MKTESFQQMHLTGRDYWWYRAKERLMELIIRKYDLTLPCPEMCKILDVGCGTGTMFGFLSERGKVIGLEPSKRALEYASSRHLASLVQADASQAPFLDKSFDMISMFDSLEHMDDDKAAMMNARRMLKDTGVLLVTAPAFQWLHSWRETQLGHRRRYTTRTMNQLIRSCGFDICFSSYMYSGLFPVLILKSLKDRIVPPPSIFKSDIVMLPEPWNSILAGWFSFEAWTCANLGLPVGTSVVAMAKPATMPGKKISEEPTS